MENVVYCSKHPKVKMIVKQGKYGDFLGCPKFPKCNETISLSKKPLSFKLTNYDLINKIYSCVEVEEVLRIFIKSECYFFIKKFADKKKNLVDFTYLIETKEILNNIHQPSVAQTIDWLLKGGKVFYSASLIYMLYALKGKLGPKWLESSWNYWLSPYVAQAPLFHEWNIRAAIENNKDNFFWELLNIELAQFLLNTRYGQADIVGNDTQDYSEVIIELKKGKHRPGIRQVLNYRDDFFRNNKKNVKCYVIGLGYPVEYIDDLIDDGNNERIGLISYVVENGEILFIPWKKATAFKKGEMVLRN